LNSGHFSPARPRLCHRRVFTRSFPFWGFGPSHRLPPHLCKGKAVVIESDEDSSEGPIYKKPKPTPVMVSHSSSSDRSVSPRGRTTDVSLLPDLGGTGASTPPVPELPLVLQHAIKGFRQGVPTDLDEATARERLASNLGRFSPNSSLYYPGLNRGTPR